jgi:hypothetical protein
MGGGYFVLEGEANEDERAMVEAIKKGNIRNFDFYLGVDIIDYDGLYFGERKTLLMEMMEAAAAGVIPYGNARYFTTQIISKCPNVLNACDCNGGNFLDYAVELLYPEFVDLVFKVPAFRVTLLPCNQIFFGELVFNLGKEAWFRKILEDEQWRSQKLALLEYGHEKLVKLTEFVRRGSRIGNEDGRLLARLESCSRLVVRLSKSIAEEARTEKEKKIVEAICASDSEEVCRLLAESININYQDPRGRTILMYAVAMGDLGLTVAILEKNPRLDVTDHEGKTVWDIAQQNRNEDLIAALEQAQKKQVREQIDGHQAEAQRRRVEQGQAARRRRMELRKLGEVEGRQMEQIWD